MKNYLFLLLFITPFYHYAQEESETSDEVIKTIYYNDSIPAVIRWYGNDKKLDSVKTYYKSGELNEDFHYSKGYLDGLSFQFNKKGEKLTTWEFQKGKLNNRTDHLIEFTSKTEEKVKTLHERLIVLNEKLEQNPNDFKSTFQRASIRHNLGNLVLALNDFKKIEKGILKVQKSKEIPEKMLGSIFDHLASIYSDYEMENQTIHYKIKAVNASPKESRLYYNLGSYLIEIKSYRLGIVFLNRAIEMVPDHSFANWALAIAYSDLEDYDKALNCVNIAFKNVDNLYKNGIGTAERDLWTTRGFIYHKLGESTKGIVDLEESLTIDANNSFALRNLGVIYHDLGEYSKSCELLQRAKELGYQKTYDQYDLDDYLEHSCNNKLTDHEVIKLSDRPYVYPNPVKDKMDLYHFNFENFNYAIYNFESLLIQKGKSENKSIDISSLSSGLYILTIEAGGMVNTFKIVKE